MLLFSASEADLGGEAEKPSTAGAGAAGEGEEGEKEGGEGEAEAGATPVPQEAAAGDGKKLTNQFNYSERASQTYNNPYRVSHYKFIY